MSDLLRPDPPAGWRARLGAVAGSVRPGRVVAAVATVVVTAAAALWLLRAPPPPIESTLPIARPLAVTTAAPAATASTAPAELVVQAAGAVTQPGVYRVPAGARVADVITAAGGVTADADPGAVRLAARVADGDRVWVPRVGEVPPAASSSPDSGGVTGAAGSGAGGGPVDLNTAGVAELDALPGVGPATAAAIVAHRDSQGPFASVDELLDVRGIGPAKLDALRPLVTV